MTLPQTFLLSAVTLLSLAQGLLGQQVVTALGCVKCVSYNTGICGLRNSVGQSPPQIVQQSCPAGTTFCYTYVTAGAGKEPYVKRGCGQLACTQLPAGSGIGENCDDNGMVAPPSSGAFNVSRSFSSGEPNRQQIGVLQYCQGQLCNAGLVADFNYPGYYVMRADNAAVVSVSAQILSLLAPLILALSYL